MSMVEYFCKKRSTEHLLCRYFIPCLNAKSIKFYNTHFIVKLVLNMEISLWY